MFVFVDGRDLAENDEWLSSPRNQESMVTSSSINSEANNQFV